MLILVLFILLTDNLFNILVHNVEADLHQNIQVPNNLPNLANTTNLNSLTVLLTMKSNFIDIFMNIILSRTVITTPDYNQC